MNMIRIDSPEVQAFEKEHLATLRSLAPECMVLLKKNGDFPLSAPCKVALYGAGARETIKGGTGSGDVNVRHYISVEEGLENAGFTVTTKLWMEGYKAARESVIQDFYEGITKEAKELGKSVNQSSLSAWDVRPLNLNMIFRWREKETSAFTSFPATPEKALTVPARKAIIC